MPAPFLRRGLANALAAALASLAMVPAVFAPAVAAAAPVENSGLDAALFYQLMIGEIELRSNSGKGVARPSA